MMCIFNISAICINVNMLELVWLLDCIHSLKAGTITNFAVTQPNTAQHSTAQHSRAQHNMNYHWNSVTFFGNACLLIRTLAAHTPLYYYLAQIAGLNLAAFSVPTCCTRRKLSPYLIHIWYSSAKLDNSKLRPICEAIMTWFAKADVKMYKIPVLPSCAGHLILPLTMFHSLFWRPHWCFDLVNMFIPCFIQYNTHHSHN